MKVLLCGFGDLIGAGSQGAADVQLGHMPFKTEEIERADIVAISGDQRILVLKDRHGPGRMILSPDDFLDMVTR